MRWLVVHTRRPYYNDHLHIDFFLGALPGEIHLYGADHADYRAIRALSAYEAACKVRPDAALVWIQRYEDEGPTLPAGLPTVYYEPNFHYRDDPDALFAGASLIITRGADQRCATVPTAWLPFSVRPCTQTKVRRRPKVAFLGSQNPAFYSVRHRALEALQRAGLVGTRVHGHQPLDRYLRELQSHAFGITCSARWGLENAKHVEIPAAGAGLLTDGRCAVDRLLPADSYYVYTPENVVDVVRQALRRPHELRERAELARKHVLEHHTDEVRTAELRALLKAHGVDRCASRSG